jgi:hypothetical protein
MDIFAVKHHFPPLFPTSRLTILKKAALVKIKIFLSFFNPISSGLMPRDGYR